MKQTWRWFGPEDSITVNDILQAGVQGFVTSLYDLPPGAVWSQSRIGQRKAEIATLSDNTPSGLEWDVVESLPVSEAIKTQTGASEDHLNAYCQSIENLAAQGITLICYNFMPVLDWTRTHIAKRLPNGATCMSFDLIDFAMFDMHILAREKAALDYPHTTVASANKRWKQTKKYECAALTNTMLAGFPGSTLTMTPHDLNNAMAAYRCIDRDQLHQNFKAFLEAVIPTAERLSIKLCCHPDDPPWPVLGLPRIVSNEADLAWLSDAYKSDANGLTFCSGSLGARGDNDLCAIAERIYFVHLRNVRRQNNIGPNSFYEDTHLGGSTNMIELLNKIRTTHPDSNSLPMRPDHGQDILTDLGNNTTPGYPLCGRMRGLAELRGALLASEAVHRTEQH